jgi:aldose 1-epimerase
MVSKRLHGVLDSGEQVMLYTLEAGAYKVEISTYGGTIVRLWTPDRQGVSGDVVLGYDSLAEYGPSTTYFGAIIGRYANRIARGRFTIDGKTYAVPRNDHGLNALHGGTIGFDRRVWAALTSEADGAPGLHLSLFSADGEMGFPGNMRAYVEYILKPSGGLEIGYSVTCDQKCPVNLTNHSYFNLACGGDILGHQMMLDCDRYVPVASDLIPTGVVVPVSGTAFDFTTPKKIGHDIERAGGYDHCMVLRECDGRLREFAMVMDPFSGRMMKVSTTKPAVQLYTGNFLNGKVAGKGGVRYPKHGGFCLETQYFPDAMNQSAFPNCILMPGEEYQHTTVYQFGVVG